jgi:hypothetical protein
MSGALGRVVGTFYGATVGAIHAVRVLRQRRILRLAEEQIVRAGAARIVERAELLCALNAPNTVERPSVGYADGDG